MLRFLAHQYRYACRTGLRREAITRALRTYVKGF